MPEPDLFLSLAEIAGVFVGFGALITVRSGSAAEAEAISVIRWVMASGVWVIVCALAPVIASQYAVGGHELWLACAVLALVLLATSVLALGRTPENRADVATTLAVVPRVQVVLVMGVTFWLPTAALVLALGAVLLGLAPAQEQALYLTAVALGLVQAALQLLAMVFWRSAPPAEPGQPAAEASGTPDAAAAAGASASAGLRVHLRAELVDRAAQERLDSRPSLRIELGERPLDGVAAPPVGLLDHGDR